MNAKIKTLSIFILTVFSMLMLCSCKQKVDDPVETTQPPEPTEPVVDIVKPTEPPVETDNNDNTTDVETLEDTQYIFGDTRISFNVPQSWSNKYIVQEVVTDGDYPAYEFVYPLTQDGTALTMLTVNIVKENDMIEKFGTNYAYADDINMMGYFDDEYVVYYTFSNDQVEDEGYLELLEDAKEEDALYWYIPEKVVVPEGSQPLVDAITNARSDEENQYMEITADPAQDIYLNLFELEADDIKNFAVSVSMMNVKAYGIAVILPSDGNMDKVMAGLQHYVEGTQLSFEQYLADQYEVAKNAVVEQVGPYAVMVMCENSDEVFASIKDSLK